MEYPLATCDIPSDWVSDFSQCLYEWQALEAGVLALSAAFITATFLRRQISQKERHEVERMARQHKAVRATLPLTLNGLCETMRMMLISLDKAKKLVGTQGYTKEFDAPTTPDQHVEELQAVILSTEEVSVTEPIAQIIREIQTLWARVTTLRNKAEQRRRVGLKQDINDWILQSAAIHAIIESLFDYARSESEMGPLFVTWERAESVIFQLGLEDRELTEKIAEKLKKSPKLWILNDRS